MLASPQRIPLSAMQRFLRSIPVSGDQVTIYATAAFLGIPIVVFSIFAYEIPASVLLAPMVAIAVFRRLHTLEGRLFVGAVSAGLFSCLIGWCLDPNYQLLRSVLSLTLFLFAPSFIFLGQFVSVRGVDFGKVSASLAIVFAFFAITVVFPVVLGGQLVKLDIEEVSTAHPQLGGWLNLTFLGLAVHGTWGVLSLAQMFAIQSFLSIGVLLDRFRLGWRQLALGLGFVCCIVVVIGSSARSAQLALPWLLITVVLVVARSSVSRLITGMGLVLGLISALYFGLGDVIAQSRFGESVIGYQEMGLSGFSSGRSEILYAAIQDVVAQPVVGVGFGPFGRYTTGAAAGEALANSSTHVYFLTVLWKGGLLFAVPFFLLLLTVLIRVWRRRKTLRGSASCRLSVSAIAVAFVVFASTWDILMVPSTGALMFFLLGALSIGPEHSECLHEVVRREAEARGRPSRDDAGPGLSPFC